MKVKCANCGIKRKLESLHGDFERLMLAYGVQDRNGRRRMTVYCRDCRHISYYSKPAIGFKRLTECIDSRELYSRYRDGLPEAVALTELAAKIQLALKEDRVLPDSWELV